MKLLIELHYFPGIEYFSNILSADEIVIEVCENFQKQTFRNRCKILGANKVENLIVPIKHNQSKMSIKDVEIDWGQRWLPVHWGAICSAYGKSPFFDFYIGYFEKTLSKKFKYLFDLNLEILTVCLKLLQIQIKVSFTTSYYIGEFNGIVDLRDTIKAKNNLAANPNYIPSSYIQNFGKQFVPSLSIVDLLFSEGNFAKDVLYQSIESKEQISNL